MVGPSNCAVTGRRNSNQKLAPISKNNLAGKSSDKCAKKKVKCEEKPKCIWCNHGGGDSLANVPMLQSPTSSADSGVSVEKKVNFESVEPCATIRSDSKREGTVDNATYNDCTEDRQGEEREDRESKGTVDQQRQETGDHQEMENHQCDPHSNRTDESLASRVASTESDQTDVTVVTPLTVETGEGNDSSNLDRSEGNTEPGHISSALDDGSAGDGLLTVASPHSCEHGTSGDNVEGVGPVHTEDTNRETTPDDLTQPRPAGEQQTDVIQCDMTDVKECRNLFRDEVQRLNSSLVQFRQCCEDEKKEYEATLQKDKEELMEDIQRLKQKKQTELQRYNSLVKLKQLQEEQVLTKQKETLLKQDEEMLDKEDQLLTRLSGLNVYEQEMDDVENYLTRRHDIAKQRAEDLRLLNEELKVARDELEVDKRQLNLTENEDTRSQVARRNWEFLQKTLVDKKDMLQSALTRTTTDLSATRHQLQERDMQVTQLHRKVSDLERASCLKDDRISELNARLTAAIRHDMATSDDATDSNGSLSTTSHTRGQHASSSSGRSSLLRSATMRNSLHRHSAQHS